MKISEPLIFLILLLFRFDENLNARSSLMRVFLSSVVLSLLPAARRSCVDVVALRITVYLLFQLHKSEIKNIKFSFQICYCEVLSWNLQILIFIQFILQSGNSSSDCLLSHPSVRRLCSSKWAVTSAVTSTNMWCSFTDISTTK